MADEKEIKRLQRQNQLLSDLTGKQKTYNDIVKETRSLREEVLDNLRQEEALGDFNVRRLRSEKDLASLLVAEQKRLKEVEEQKKKVYKDTAAMREFGGEQMQKQATAARKNARELIKATKNQIALLEEEAAHRQYVNEQLGLSDNLVKGLADIPGIGAFVDAEEATAAMEESIRGGSTAFMGLLGYAKDMAKENIVDIGLVFAAKSLSGTFQSLKTSLIEISELQTQFSKDLGLSDKDARNMRASVAAMANETGRVSINSKDTQAAFSTLNEQFGTAATTLRSDIVAETAILMKLTDMSAEAAGRFAMQANVTGQNMTKIKEEARASVVAGEQERGVRVNINKVLDEAGRTTGVIAANLGFNLQAIAKSITVAKQFGLTLQDLAGISSNLLDFQSSIEAELQAELFTGKQLNLEKARLAALTGDYETLTKEVMDNVGSELEFAQMNVLAKEKMATALGMNVDQMSDLVFKNANLAELAEEARDRGEEELAQSLEKRHLADQMNDATEKLHMLFVDLMNGPLGVIANIMSSIASNAGLAATAFGIFAGIKLGGMLVSLGGLLIKLGLVSKAALTTNAALTFGFGIPILIAAVVAGIAALNAMSPGEGMDDGTISPEGLVVKSPKGSIQLNKDDSVIAGTNLGGKGDTSEPEPSAADEEYRKKHLKALKEIKEATMAGSFGGAGTLVYSAFNAVKRKSNYTTKYS